eukprot:TRINITY_DN321_c1_g4_i1.p1 TRINITY_DN321_c1_g4~~TRINITY_DN321_c1_g4_i1.p1  ORF type:complete len:236 (+),score=66.39 TRINITY_DN321_c1_g4_i1:98-805(+)
MANRFYSRLPPVHPKDLIRKWKIVRGDTVEVISGKDKGQRGLVKKVLRKENTALVEGLNLVKKTMKPGADNVERKGVTFIKEMPIHYSNLALIDPATNDTAKVGYMFSKKGNKLRINKETKQPIPKPKPTLNRVKKPGLQDTVPGVVLKQTFNISELMPKLEKLNIGPILEENRWEMYLKKSLAIDAVNTQFVPADIEDIPPQQTEAEDVATEAATVAASTSSAFEEQQPSASKA